MPMSEIENMQACLNEADALRQAEKYHEAVGKYLEAMQAAKKEWNSGIKDDDLQRRVIFMACNGIGMCYSKLGNVDATIENFSDAVNYAPTEDARIIAMGNLKKYQKAVADKTNTWPISSFDDPQDIFGGKS